MTAPNTEYLSEANRWLEKAVRLEGEGKSEKIVNLAFDKAWRFEQAAFGLGPAPMVVVGA